MKIKKVFLMILAFVPLALSGCTSDTVGIDLKINDIYKLSEEFINKVSSIDGFSNFQEDEDFPHEYALNITATNNTNKYVDELPVELDSYSNFNVSLTPKSSANYLLIVKTDKELEKDNLQLGIDYSYIAYSSKTKVADEYLDAADGDDQKKIAQLEKKLFEEYTKKEESSLSYNNLIVYNQESYEVKEQDPAAILGAEDDTFNGLVAYTSDVEVKNDSPVDTSISYVTEGVVLNDNNEVVGLFIDFYQPNKNKFATSLKTGETGTYESFSVGISGGTKQIFASNG